jgi:peptidyl-prolyl cis-trans isomerase C
LTSHRGWICLLLLATAAWAQSEKSTAAPAAPKPPTLSHAAAAKAAEDSVPANAAVITIPGICDKPSLEKPKAADCKTVITRAEFEQLVDAVAPTIAPAARRQLATQYGVALVMVHKAHEMGLDKGPKYEELMKVARVGVLTKELNQNLQEEAGHVSDQDVENYYHKNESTFRETDLQRVFIPRTRQVAESKDKLSDDAKKAQQESEEPLKKLADTLRARAAAGEDFDKLQEEASAAADFKGKPPTKLGKVRRTSLPPAQAEVMSLKPGETSQVIPTPNGYLIYKVGEKDTLPLDKVHDVIVSTLRSQRIQDSMQAIQQSATPELNDAYFADALPSAPSAKSPTDGQGAPAAKSPESGPK